MTLQQERTVINVKAPDWYRALNLNERQPLQAHAMTTDTGQKRLERWQNESVFGTNPEIFEERLTIDGFTTESFLQTLSLTEAQLNNANTPDWLQRLAEDFQPVPDEERLTFFVHDGSQHTQGNQSLMGFLNLIEPLLRSANNRVHTRLAELLDDDSRIPLEVVNSYMVEGLLNFLVHMALTRTMVLELNVARLEGILRPSPQQGFQDFVNALLKPEFALKILQEYPVIARQVVVAIEQWERNSIEFIDRFLTDWDEIQKTFFADEDPGKVNYLQTGAGDKHNDGHTVFIIGFENDAKLVYKPRSLAVDVHFQEMLTWLNERGDHPSFRTLNVINRDDYGWIEFVHAAPCSTADQLDRFYQRQGGYLALLYALQAVDFHYENLIAAGEHPILIDLESLFHTLTEGVAIREADLERKLGSTMEHSVLRVGLLPQRMWGNDDSNGVDMSGLGGREGQMTPNAVPSFEDVGTAAMRFTRKRVEIPGGNNRPTLQGQDVNLQDYTDSIVEGFRKVLQLLIDERQAFIDGPLAAFGHDEVRIIARPTRTYGMLLYESYHPDLMRDALTRDRFFDRLWLNVRSRPFLKHLIEAERRDLWKGDVPIFTTTPLSRDLTASDGSRIPDFFDINGMQFVINHFNKIDQSSLEQQIWFIRASIATLSMGVGSAHWTHYIPEEYESTADRDRLIRMASELGDRLDMLSLEGNDGIGWLGLSLVNEKNWVLLPLAADLYNGMGGVVLFLAYLAEVSGNQRYRDIAEKGLQTIQNLMKNANPENYTLGGAFDGLGSLMYLFTHLGILWDRPDLLDEAEKLVQYLPPLIEKDEVVDIIGGTAGNLAVLLALYEQRPTDKILQVARIAGDYLIETSIERPEGLGWQTTMSAEPLAGFSHGAAGIAWVLTRLYGLTDDERYQETAIKAIAYERSIFSEERENWPDLREFDLAEFIDDPNMLAAIEESQEDGTYMHAWCHGAPGVGIARVGMLPFLKDAEIEHEIEAAVRSTVREGFGLNHSLCHGDLGNLEFLLLASRRANHPKLETIIQQKLGSLAESVEQLGWLCGVPSGVETPGLMTGLAGIGYAFLRFAYPDRVPSVLLLEGPIKGQTSNA